MGLSRASPSRKDATRRDVGRLSTPRRGLRYRSDGIGLRAAGFVGPIDGIDLSSVSLKRAERHGIYRSLTAVDLQALPLPIPDDAYDALMCVGVLTYIPDGEGVLRVNGASSGIMFSVPAILILSQRPGLESVANFDVALMIFSCIAGASSVWRL